MPPPQSGSPNQPMSPIPPHQVQNRRARVVGGATTSYCSAIWGGMEPGGSSWQGLKFGPHAPSCAQLPGSPLAASPPLGLGGVLAVCIGQVLQQEWGGTVQGRERNNMEPVRISVPTGKWASRGTVNQKWVALLEPLRCRLRANGPGTTCSGQWGPTCK